MRAQPANAEVQLNACMCVIGVTVTRCLLARHRNHVVFCVKQVYLYVCLLAIPTTLTRMHSGLDRMSYNNAHHEWMGESGVISDIQAAMQNHPGDVEIQITACRCVPYTSSNILNKISGARFFECRFFFPSHFFCSYTIPIHTTLGMLVNPHELNTMEVETCHSPNHTVVIYKIDETGKSYLVFNSIFFRGRP